MMNKVNALWVKVRCILLPFLSLLFLIYNYESVSLWYLYLCVLFVTLTAEIGYHRIASHKCKKVSTPTYHMLMFFGAIVNLDSPLIWSATHLNHHIHSDSLKDPHPVRHRGWRAMFPERAGTFRLYAKQSKDPVIRFWHEYNFYVYSIWFAIMLALGGDWFLYGVAGLTAATWFQFRFISIYLLHKKIGTYRNFETKDDSQNAPLLFPLILGACWHNNHHKKGSCTTTKIHWWEFDPHATIIKWLR